MNGSQFCSEQEAVALAGVSTRTLLRFSEAGYLSVKSTNDGSKLFERAQIEQIFGVAAGTATIHASAEEVSAQESADVATESDYADHLEEEQQAKFESAPASEAWRPAAEPEVTRISSAEKIGVSDDAAEVSRLKNLLSLQERILDAKDDEIADLRNQRAWLRERIEKLEEKSDRDQILLLSETQTIRSLIAYQEARKSPIRQFLEWTGLATPQQVNTLPQSSEYKQSSGSASSRTIEVPRAANGD